MESEPPLPPPRLAPTATACVSVLMEEVSPAVMLTPPAPAWMDVEVSK